MRKWLNTYFSISKREFNGILVMLFFLTVISFVPDVYEYFMPKEDHTKEELQAIEKLEWMERRRDSIKYERRYKNIGRLFKFDPNKQSKESWQQLGFTERQAQVLVRYVERGGRFRKKEDLRKMYTISPEMYVRLEPFIIIDTKDSSAYARKIPSSFVKQREVVMVSLNTADTLMMDAIRGVGPAFARRIVKYRDRLGGFYHKEQLLEVPGLDSAKYKEIENQVTINASAIRPILINTVTFQELRQHPYLNFKQINAIIQFRKQHGNYSNIAELKQIAILPAQTVDKLAPYISFKHD